MSVLGIPMQSMVDNSILIVYTSGYSTVGAEVQALKHWAVGNTNS